ncbi:NAD(P)-dependent dehydrogenase (short-subunit alcohol dehydrogenase family) [Arthrobacter stackebrandtii]|uniref:NAD(P)-dependent dehydrogenase (Short-subunit alcohol dehydrogenase family) n=1 Tax=Arthrobacter stackebrandtii TaxID=272161 RepID=A0ABS4Z1P4_9MICC|nr:SDR family oxidoreductase [Arthrobacter stackebrandtii]MBP2414963.1 NAD(P)-dependent dehydrogenase (short-subunit alcohol dehydrogenase family) [Arthrobacter stackebrandtii]PYH00877.1 oxidoreductase [Arthrobacter stackebrandtii]
MAGSLGVAIVTGASRGIGAATARLAARAGYAVVVNYSADDGGASQVVRSITAAGGLAQAVKADVSSPDDVRALFDAAQAMGRVRAVVNNAAITGDMIGPLVDVPPDVVRRVLDVNVAGMLFMCQEAQRRMSTATGGSGGGIVNISSTAVKAGSPGTWVHYAASKGAVDVLTVGFAAEAAAHGIRVNAVSPGATNTGLHAAAGAPDRVARQAHLVPLGRGGEPEEVAAAVMWLLSDEASYVTGAILPVAGGR